MASNWFFDLSGWAGIGLVVMIFSVVVFVLSGHLYHQRQVRRRRIHKIQNLAKRLGPELVWLDEARMCGSLSDDSTPPSKADGVDQTLWQSKKALELAKPRLFELRSLPDAELAELQDVLSSAQAKVEAYAEDMPITATRTTGPILVRSRG